MSLDARVLAVIQALYDAALDETLWPVALKELADVTRSQAATFWVLDRSTAPRLPVFTSLNFDPAFIAEYLDRVVPSDPTVQYLVAHPDHPIVHDGVVITEREKKRHPYYDWHERFSDTRFRLVGQVPGDGQLQAGVALHRTGKVGRYEPPDIQQFATLFTHLERALAIGFRLGSLGTLQRCTADVLDRSSNAILLLDEGRRIVYANNRAKALHLTGDGFAMQDGAMLLSRQDNQRLQALIAEVHAARAAGSFASGGTMQASRPSGKRPYLVIVAPVSSRHTTLSTVRPAACVVVVDPEHQVTLPIDSVRRAFGLTPAEAKLATRLAEGEDLRTAASSLGITYGTARERLTTVFQKTNTRRQGELIRLVLMVGVTA